MSNVFVSYRRDDSSWATQNLLRRLREEFGADAIFADIDGIEPGLDFRDVLEDQLSNCSVLIVVVGEKWINAKDDTGKQRLSDKNDWVRVELEKGLENQSARVIPLVIRPASMPKEGEVPPELSDFCYMQEVAIFPQDFEVGFGRLATAIDKVLVAKGLQGRRIDRDDKKTPDQQNAAFFLKVLGVAIGLVLGIVVLVGLTSRGAKVSQQREYSASPSTTADKIDLERVLRRQISKSYEPDLESTVEERVVAALGQPDYSNFEFRFDERTWNFERYEPTLVSKENEYCSALVSDRTVVVVKTGEANQLRFQARTRGKDLAFSPQTFGIDSHVEFDGTMTSTGEYTTSAKHLCFNVSKIEVNTEFSITYRTTYWDSPPDDAWFGAMSYPGCLRIRVFAIGPRPNYFADLDRRKCDSFESEIEKSNDGTLVFNSDNGSFVWTMSTPEASKIYLFYF